MLYVVQAVLGFMLYLVQAVLGLMMHVPVVQGFMLYVVLGFMICVPIVVTLPHSDRPTRPSHLTVPLDRLILVPR